MPLMQGKSKKAFSKNVETEMKSGKPQDQALAIAYNVKRHNAKKMAHGGAIPSPTVAAPIEHCSACGQQMMHHQEPGDGTGSPTMDRAMSSHSSAADITKELLSRRAQKMAEGGMVGKDDSEDALDPRVEFSTHLDEQDASMPTEEHDADHADDDAEVGLVGQILQKRRARKA